MTEVRFHPAAKSELLDAQAYYEDRAVGLGDEFGEEVEELVRRVVRNPRIGAPHKATGLRHARVRRFPYVLFYLESGQTLWIVAVAHGKRRPDYWSRRKVQ